MPCNFDCQCFWIWYTEITILKQIVKKNPVDIALRMYTISCSLSSLLLYVYIKYEMKWIGKGHLIIRTKFSVSQRLVCLFWDNWLLTSIIWNDRWLIISLTCVDMFMSLNEIIRKEEELGTHNIISI